MKRLSHAVFTAALVIVLVGPARAQDPDAKSVAAEKVAGSGGKVIPVWPTGAPGSEGWTQKEVEYRSEGDHKAMVRNVTTPTLTAFLPDPSAATGAAVVICPGGGFRFLSWESEGAEVAQWLRARGVAAFVLKYRLLETPASEDQFRKEMAAFFGALASRRERTAAGDAPKPEPAKDSGKPAEASQRAIPEETRKIAALAIADGRQAIKVVRRHASEWGIKPERVGIMGFSAGGTVTMGVVMDHDEQSRPDFAAPIYGGGTGSARVPDDAPPLFILCAADDQLAAAGSARLYSQWKAANRPAELHIYEKGGHGFGMTPKGLPADRWIERFGDWLGQRGLIKPGAAPQATRALQSPQEPQPELAGTLSAEVSSKSGRVERISITVGDGGSGPYKAVLAGDPTLPTHTIYRPRDLGPFGKGAGLPIVLWGNGGGRSSSGEFRVFLTEIASHGFLVVAIGPAGNAATQGSEAPVGTSRSSELLDALNWAIAQNGKDGEYRGKIDTSKVAVMGASLGGLQALEVSPDPRVTTTVVWNSGLFNALPQPPRGAAAPRMGFPAVTKAVLKRLHGPIAYFVGGPSDGMSQNAADDFARIQNVPALLASRDVGHYPATYLEPHGGAFAVAGVAWLKWQLKGDEQARQMFVGEPCGLSADPKWKVERKNIR